MTEIEKKNIIIKWSRDVVKHCLRQMIHAKGELAAAEAVYTEYQKGIDTFTNGDIRGVDNAKKYLKQMEQRYEEALEIEAFIVDRFIQCEESTKITAP